MKITDEAVEAAVAAAVQANINTKISYRAMEVALEAALPHLWQRAVRVKPLEGAEKWDIVATAVHIALGQSKMDSGHYHEPTFNAAKAGALEALERAQTTLGLRQEGPSAADGAGRDIWDCANRLLSYIDPSTPQDLAEFLHREAHAAADLARSVADARARILELEKALEFYRDKSFTPKTNPRYGGLEWVPTEALLDDCSDIARTALGGQSNG